MPRGIFLLLIVFGVQRYDFFLVFQRFYPNFILLLTFISSNSDDRIFEECS